MAYNPFRDPNYNGLLKIYKTVEVPVFVKEAAAIGEQMVGDLPHDVFGDPGKRLYPLNNKSNTWLSRQYFGNDKGNYTAKEASLIESRIQKAAAFWKLDEPSYIREDPYGGMAHRISIADPAQHEVIGFDIKCQDHWKQACTELFQNRSKYTFDMRRQFAEGLLGAPRNLRPASIVEHAEEYMHKAACQGTCVTQNVVNCIYKRATQVRVSNPELYKNLMLAAGEFNRSEGGFVPATELRKVAETIDIVDRGLGFDKFYGQGCFDFPENELFSVTESVMTKIAEEAVVLTNGNTLSQSELVANKDRIGEFFTKYAGEKPYADDDEMIDVLRSLPRSDADAFESYMGQ